MIKLKEMNKILKVFSMLSIVGISCIVMVALSGCGGGKGKAEMAGYLAALNGSDSAKKQEALTALSQMGANAAPATQALIATLKDADSLNRTLAATILGQIGKPAAAALPALREMMKDSDADIVKAAYNGIRGIDPNSPEAKTYMPNIMTPTQK